MSGNELVEISGDTKVLENLMLTALFSGLYYANDQDTHELYICADIFFSQIFTRSESKIKKTSRWKKAIEEELLNLCNIGWISTEIPTFDKLCNSSDRLFQELVTNIS